MTFEVDMTSLLLQIPSQGYRVIAKGSSRSWKRTHGPLTCHDLTTNTNSKCDSCSLSLRCIPAISNRNPKVLQPCPTVSSSLVDAGNPARLRQP